MQSGAHPSTVIWSHCSHPSTEPTAGIGELGGGCWEVDVVPHCKLGDINVETMDVHVGYSSFPSAALRKVWAVGGAVRVLFPA